MKDCPDCKMQTHFQNEVNSNNNSRDYEFRPINESQFYNRRDSRQRLAIQRSTSEQIIYQNDPTVNQSRERSKSNVQRRSSFQRMTYNSNSGFQRRYKNNFRHYGNDRRYKKKWWRVSKYSYQYRKHHLKELRRTAAINRLNNRNFVFKPGMINILRPNTPRNTTRFLTRKFSSKNASPCNQLMRKSSFNSKRECVSVQDNISDLFHKSCNNFARTPVLSLVDKLSISGYLSPILSDIEEDRCDLISGTMEGLVDPSLFDFDQKVPSPFNNENLFKLQLESKQFENHIELLSDIDNCDCDFKEQCEDLKFKCDSLNKILNEKNEYIKKLESKLDI